MLAFYFQHRASGHLLYTAFVHFHLGALCRLLTFIVVVLHCDNASSGGSGVVDDGLGVQGFDGEWIDHTNVYSL